jgi:hypothetical protein
VRPAPATDCAGRGQRISKGPVSMCR